MATLSVKPGQRFTLPDWHINSDLLSTNAERQRSASHQIRQEARILRNETNNQTKWDEYDNRTRLNERLDIVNRWKETLDKCLTDMDTEINSLTQVCDGLMSSSPQPILQEISRKSSMFCSSF
uniref:Tektin n=1 Tax=Pseudonaja textilis TaxID=8673 RepID=A0A670Y1Z7_PSETE